MFGKKELEKEIIKLKEENKKLTDSYGKSKSHELEEQISELEEQKTALNIRIEELNSKVDNLKSQKEEVESQKNEISRNYNILNADYDVLKNKYNADEILIKKQMSELEENAQVQDQHNEKINELNQQIKEKDIEISAYKNAISNISFTFNNDGKINPKDFDISSITSYENENKKGEKNVNITNKEKMV